MSDEPVENTEIVEEKKVPKNIIEIELVKSEIVSMYNEIKKLPETTDIRLAANIAYNRRTALLPIVQDIQDISKPPEKMSEYEGKRIELCQKYSLKDDKGNFKMEATGGYDIPEDKKSEFNTELESLTTQYKDVVDSARNKQIQLANFMLGKEKVTFRPIVLSMLVKGFKSATPDQLSCLMAMVDMDK